MAGFTSLNSFLPASNSNSPGVNFPWVGSNVGANTDSNGVSTTSFFAPLTVQPLLWDTLCPYRLIVIDANSNNLVVNGTGGKGLAPRISVGHGTASTTLDFIPITNNWIFYLPITPQQLNITDQYSINTTATLRGILEEHNGVKFKMINASGTMGVWADRGSVTQPVSPPGFLGNLFAGTLSAATNVATAFTNVVNAFSGSSSNPLSIRPSPEPSPAPHNLTSTGYYQALALQQFLEQYAEAKKNPANAGWRLVFDIPKQNQSFVVTPMQYQWQQSVNKPMEIMYTMQFKAWRRVILLTPATQIANSVTTVSPFTLQNILNGLTAARILMSASLALIGAVRSDIDTPLNILRQTVLLVKDLAGVAVSVADLPSQIVSDYNSLIDPLLVSLGVNGISGSSATNSQVQGTINQIAQAHIQREGLSRNSVATGQLGTAAANAQAASATNNIYTNPNANFLVFDQVPISQLSLTAAQQNQINNILQTAANIPIVTLKQYRQSILTFATQLSNFFGAGSAYYSQIYGTPTPIVRTSPMTVDQFEIIAALYKVVQGYDILTATTQIDDNNKQTNMDYVAGIASQLGISFNTSTSKVLSPVPFGLSVEQISARYLGDPQRWNEIVTLNNLIEPYIDESGFQYTLLSNAIGRQIVVGYNTNLYLGQIVSLRSSTQTFTARAITGIEQLSSTSFLLTLDGLANLDNFLLADQAYIQAYLPNTVNSQQKIYIPSGLAVDQTQNIIPPATTVSDPLTGLSKVDWLLTDTGDIALNNFGDVRYAYGLSNIIQALKIKFSTILGTVLLHPEFGLGVQSGIIVSEVQLQDIYANINTMIANDSRFQGVSGLQLVISGPVLSINLSVTVAGQVGVFPIQFEFNTSNT